MGHIFQYCESQSVCLPFSVFPIIEETAVTFPQQTSLQIHRPEVPRQEQNSAQCLSPGKHANSAKLYDP